MFLNPSSNAQARGGSRRLRRSGGIGENDAHNAQEEGSPNVVGQVGSEHRNGCRQGENLSGGIRKGNEQHGPRSGNTEVSKAF